MQASWIQRCRVIENIECRIEKFNSGIQGCRYTGIKV
jgi:hypothetical protein